MNHLLAGGASRNVVRWHRPNPTPGGLADKYRPSTTDLVIACKATNRYFDLDAVRQPASENTHARTSVDTASRPNNHKTSPDGNRATLNIEHRGTLDRPPHDTWIIPTEPYHGTHYATWPRQLCVIPIESMTPREVCMTCGDPRRRIVEVTRPFETTNAAWRPRPFPDSMERPPQHAWKVVRETVGWTTCNCPAPTYPPVSCWIRSLDRAQLWPWPPATAVMPSALTSISATLTWPVSELACFWRHRHEPAPALQSSPDTHNTTPWSLCSLLASDSPCQNGVADTPTNKPMTFTRTAAQCA